MINLLWPKILLLAPLPYLFRLILPAAKNTSQAALRVPNISDFNTNITSDTLKKSSHWAILLYSLAWLCLLLAAARPQWTGDTLELPVSGRDLMLAIDLSKSMDHPIRHNGRQVSRIVATKAIAGDFIKQRVGDRIGLILFGEQAYVQAPLTFDRTTVNILLQEAVTGLAGQATAIGDAIGLAVKRLDKNQNNLSTKGIQKNISDDRVLILLTDGVSNRGEITPLKAASLARKKGLRIHTIGIGRRGTRELDEVSLRKIAQITGGRYFRAYNTRDLKAIYNLLDKIEPVEKEKNNYRPKKALFYIPLTASFIFASLLALFLYVPKFSFSHWLKQKFLPR